MATLGQKNSAKLYNLQWGVFWGGGGFSFHCERFKGLVIHAVNMSANSGVIRWFDVMGKGMQGLR